ncbi:MAG: xanthine dehydrogenase family protein subunit M [Chloroflexi bacterium]|nr:xanthine dehydrogenase family protein subunit M [Chloroflexota bacterium]
MIRFDVLEAENVSHACSLLAEHQAAAKLVAGGQSLLVLLRHRQIRPGYLINIKGCPDMDHIEEDGDSIRIGALATHRALETSPLIGKKLPMLTELEHQLGCVQTRNWGTVGGNLCQAIPTSDLAPVFVSLEARAVARSISGERVIPFDSFFVGYQKTALRPDEILVEIQVPRPRPHTGGIFRKESVRFGDPAIASVSVVIRLDQQAFVEHARIVLQSVSESPVRASEAEAAITGVKVTDKVLAEATALAASAACRGPYASRFYSVAYKREMVRLLTRDNIKEAIRRAQAVWC